jgi:pyrroloquinoline quinone biosynthesis protein B
VRATSSGLWLLICALGLRSTAAELVVLGIAQDAGVPQAGCTRTCCAAALLDPRRSIDPSCLALVEGERRWLFDATPQFGRQLARLDSLSGTPASRSPQDPALAGIFVTHAHIGHYSGLLQLGRETMGAREVPVHAMPRLRQFLRTNAPWSQLVELRNLRLVSLAADSTLQLSPELRVTPLAVPHRDEFSETVGFRIEGPRHAVLYLPDIDKWELWSRSLLDQLRAVDRAYVDGTFFDEGELPGRALSEIPHPLIVETLAHIESLAPAERAKLHFIHLNHTNAALHAGSAARAAIEAAGGRVATTGERFAL